MQTEKEFLMKVESGELPLSEFNHTAHVKLGWIYLQNQPLPEALIQFRDSLKRFIALHGKSTLYHETITFAFMILIHERIQIQSLDNPSWSQFAEANPDLIHHGKTILLKLYREETLFSVNAKTSFFLPDRLTS